MSHHLFGKAGILSGLFPIDTFAATRRLTLAFDVSRHHGCSNEGKKKVSRGMGEARFKMAEFNRLPDNCGGLCSIFALRVPGPDLHAAGLVGPYRLARNLELPAPPHLQKKHRKLRPGRSNMFARWVASCLLPQHQLCRGTWFSVNLKGFQL